MRLRLVAIRILYSDAVEILSTQWFQSTQRPFVLSNCIGTVPSFIQYLIGIGTNAN